MEVDIDKKVIVTMNILEAQKLLVILRDITGKREHGTVAGDFVYQLSSKLSEEKANPKCSP